MGTKSRIPILVFENKTVILTNAIYSLVLQQKSRSSVLALLLLRAHPLRSRTSSPSQEPAFISETSSHSAFHLFTIRMTHSLAANSLRGKLSLDKRTHQAERREHRRISKYLLLNHSDDGTIRNMEKQGPAILVIYCCQKSGWI